MLVINLIVATMLIEIYFVNLKLNTFNPSKRGPFIVWLVNLGPIDSLIEYFFFFFRNFERQEKKKK